MLIPISWLKRYVPVEIPAQELAYRLTMAGLEIDDVREVGVDWGRDKVFVGHVTAVDPHPNADRLTVPTVDLGGGETVQVVCGGPNLAAGQKIAFAFAGAMLYSTKTGKTQALKKSKIRGVESAGMVCSEVELGLGDDHEGIMVLPEDAPVGTPLVDYLGDAVLDADVTPNRPDCLSILGVAHEVAALTGGTVTEPDATYPETGDPIERDVTVKITDPDLCSRYGASLIRGVKVGPSPDWLKDALAAVGMRPINNIVDVTNYVMLEYGQPLHAFDFDTIGDATVIIRAARPGEKFTTLDEEERKLEPPMLTIADSQDVIALAGVMGGQNTEVGDSTTNVLIESANFDATNTRNTATGLGMRTEASYRFERGIRQDLVPRALRRATALMLELAGGVAAKGIVDVFPVVKTPPTLTIGPEHFRRVLGAEMSTDTIDRVLTSLGFETTRDGESLEVRSPYWRADITIAEDLIEEVARIVGYDDVPATLMSTEIPHHEPRVEREVREHIRDALVAAGMQETISYSATSIEALEKVEVRTEEPNAPLRLANPMSAELSHMRTTLRSGVLQTLAFNRRMSRGEGLRLFEIGPVYLPKEEAKERDLPDEKEMLVGVVSGPRSGASWLVAGRRHGLLRREGSPRIGLRSDRRLGGVQGGRRSDTAYWKDGEGVLWEQGGGDDRRDSPQGARAIRPRRHRRHAVRDRPGGRVRGSRKGKRPVRADQPVPGGRAGHRRSGGRGRARLADSDDHQPASPREEERAVRSVYGRGSAGGQAVDCLPRDVPVRQVDVDGRSWLTRRGGTL